jgi:toxin ParE1/3/4
MPIIVLRREARRDLNGVDEFSRERFGNLVADEYMAEIDAGLARLSVHPEIGSAVAFGRVPMRSLKVGSHRLFYYFDGNRVIVVRVLHQSMNAERHLKS